MVNDRNFLFCQFHSRETIPQKSSNHWKNQAQFIPNLETPGKFYLMLGICFSSPHTSRFYARGGASRKRSLRSPLEEIGSRQSCWWQEGLLDP
jgi:hypothetical protein